VREPLRAAGAHRAARRQSARGASGDGNTHGFDTLGNDVTQVRLRALLIEDDPAYAHLIRLHLEAAGYQIRRAETGQAGLQALHEFAPDVVLLDVGLPDMDGFEVCRLVREHSNVPIVMLTSRAEERHKVQGLMLGADDYVTKPFSAPELMARLTTILRRANQRREAPAIPTIRSGDLVIDFGLGRVYKANEPVAITATEYRLLLVLSENAGRVLLVDDLLRQVWGPGYEGDSSVLRTTIGRLRQKLGDPPNGGLIKNVRGLGYTLERPPRD
jgi:two-component system KDP operon response regulator KdpE